ncbi:hypothetical protein NE237_031345 [Protea cynaroides]|uniref:MMS19 nucleotide excision repair protein n=1 Tax=Protea cynaroides TaxID=273540 RepID=A0A9Q0L133_9MAGN|nr:hypothetical protein NE237_031345 [Protea cynaroides]
MEMYLTTTDSIIRARGILLLGEVLTRLTENPLGNATVHSLIRFFTDRLVSVEKEIFLMKRRGAT